MLPSFSFAASHFVKALPWTVGISACVEIPMLLRASLLGGRANIIKNIAKTALFGAVGSVVINAALAPLSNRFAFLNYTLIKGVIAAISALFAWHFIDSNSYSRSTPPDSLVLDEVPDEENAPAAASPAGPDNTSQAEQDQAPTSDVKGEAPAEQNGEPAAPSAVPAEASTPSVLPNNALPFPVESVEEEFRKQELPYTLLTEQGISECHTLMVLLASPAFVLLSYVPMLDDSQRKLIEISKKLDGGYLHWFDATGKFNEKCIPSLCILKKGDDKLVAFKYNPQNGQFRGSINGKRFDIDASEIKDGLKNLGIILHTISPEEVQSCLPEPVRKTMNMMRKLPAEQRQTFEERMRLAQASDDLAEMERLAEDLEKACFLADSTVSGGAGPSAAASSASKRSDLDGVD